MIDPKILQEGTVLIAKFDGWELKEEPDFIAPYQCFQKWEDGTIRTVPYIDPEGKLYEDFPEKLGYHKNMGKLMELILKVRAMGYGFELYMPSTTANHAHIYLKNEQPIHINRWNKDNDPTETTWLALYTFLTHYHTISNVN